MENPTEREVIVLSSDDEDEAEYAPPPRDGLDAAWDLHDDLDFGLLGDEEPMEQHVDNPQDERWDVDAWADMPGGEASVTPPRNPEPQLDFSEDGCLRKVLELYPDIAHDHVRDLYRAGLAGGNSANQAWCEELIVSILEAGAYPRERDRRQELKRKREAAVEDTAKKWEEERTDQSKEYTFSVITILRNEFPEVPVAYIRSTVARDPTLFKAYLKLYEGERTYHTEANRPYNKVRKRQILAAAPMPPRHDALADLQKELTAVKERVDKEAVERTKQEQKRRTEAENERDARANNTMADCGCCFTEYPTNRMTFCNGEEAHLFCHECAVNYVKAEIGQGKCRPKCMDTGGCTAEFTRKQLLTFLDAKTFETLERFQQKEDLRLAGLDDLEECPFCDFKMICLPKEIDREFRCLNTECEKVSCRLCREETHVPRTCEEAAKEKTVDARHQVEEAMTAALVRSCNKCKNKFVKDYGCNKMTCSACGNIQCYCCGKNVIDYTHFETEGHVARPGKRCPLYDNTDARHEEEVKKAEKAALEQIKKDNPHLSEKDLKVKVSQRVEQAEQARINAGGRARPVARAAHRVVPPYRAPRVPPPVGVQGDLQAQRQRDLMIARQQEQLFREAGGRPNFDHRRPLLGMPYQPLAVPLPFNPYVGAGANPYQQAAAPDAVPGPPENVLQHRRRPGIGPALWDEWYRYH